MVNLPTVTVGLFDSLGTPKGEARPPRTFFTFSLSLWIQSGPLKKAPGLPFQELTSPPPFTVVTVNPGLEKGKQKDKSCLPFPGSLSTRKELAGVSLLRRKLVLTSPDLVLESRPWHEGEG